MLGRGGGGKRLTGKSQSSTSDPKPPLLSSGPPILNTTPLFKLPAKKATRTYLWNAKIIEIDKIPIYAQVLTSEQVAETDVKGWDKVLADIIGLHAEVAEKHIAVFWAGWKQQLQLTQRANAQKHKDEKSSKSKTGTLSAIPAPAVSSSSTQSSTTTLSGGGEKRKHSGTPASTKPAGKHNYAETVGSGGAGSVPRSKVHILWVHSSLVEKGEISKGYFNQVISRCNQIKIRGVLNGEAEHDWSPSMHGQPTYDKINSRGKIVLSRSTNH